MGQAEMHEDSCNLFELNKWDRKTHKWMNKLFIKESIPQFFHIPLPGIYRRTLIRMWKRAKNANAAPDMKDFLLLSYDPSPWKSDLYLLVTGDVPLANNVRLSGSFFSKVFDGPYSKIPQFIREMDIMLARDNKLAIKYYFYFATCPECAKKYGHNYIVAFAEV